MSKAPNAPKSAANNSRQAGSLASRKVTFGDHSRYAVAAVHTRFDAVEWFVWDAERIDPLFDAPEVIRQAPTFAAAVEGL